MNIEAMIKRRRRRDGESRLVEAYGPLSPATHVDELADRGRLLEQLLDHLDPVFDGRLPPHGYLHGPKGVGKSAAVTALFAQLARQVGDRAAIHTTTRVSPSRPLEFVYVDARHQTSDFAFYHALLDGITDEPVPRHGISTDRLRERLRDRLGGPRAGLVVAVDHVGEPATTDPETLLERFAALPERVSWLAVGRADPATTTLSDYTAESIHVAPYRASVLASVVLQRATDALGHSVLADGIATRIAEGTDGDAHDALAVLFAATDRADRAGRDAITADDVDAARGELPHNCVTLGRVVALPENKQVVLRALVDLPSPQRASVTEATAAIADEAGLAAGTIKRYLYELAAAGIVDRVRAEGEGEQGRPPSRLEPKFPPTVFRRLYDIGDGRG